MYIAGNIGWYLDTQCMEGEGSKGEEGRVGVTRVEGVVVTVRKVHPGLT